MKKVDKTVVQILNSVTVKKVNLNIFIGLVINLIVVNRKSICSLERLDTWPQIDVKICHIWQMNLSLTREHKSKISSNLATVSLSRDGNMYSTSHLHDKVHHHQPGPSNLKSWTLEFNWTVLRKQHAWLSSLLWVYSHGHDSFYFIIKREKLKI